MRLFNRMIRAAKLEPELYEEVERDVEATKEALLAVLIVAACNAIGNIGIFGAKGIITGLVGGILGWVLWSLVIFIIGVKGFKHTSDMGELLRCLGFSYSPYALSIFGFIPVLGPIIIIVAFVWALVAFVIATRQALDCGTGRAALVAVLGFIVYLIITAVLSSLIGGL